MGRYRRPYRESPVTGIIASIQTRLDADCIARQCRKDGCSVSLVGTPQQRPIVDFDKPGAPLGPAAPRCDYLFLAESSCRELWIAPVELKKGPVDASKAIPQLQAGAHAASRRTRGGAPRAGRYCGGHPVPPRSRRGRYAQGKEEQEQGGAGKISRILRASSPAQRRRVANPRVPAMTKSRNFLSSLRLAADLRTVVAYTACRYSVPGSGRGWTAFSAGETGSSVTDV